MLKLSIEKKKKTQNMTLNAKFLLLLKNAIKIVESRQKICIVTNFR